ncbi:MAG TPA: hypothetical protein VHV83_12740 [Armatimonadota bacterium]|nr:hypothetical protein [Armatimonadota bacterium]
MADDEMVYEDEQPEPVDEQGELEQAAEYADEVPEKFRGKSPDELIAMYCNLESDYTRKAQQLREYERQQEEMAMDDEPDMAQERLVPIAEAEFQRLLGLGYQDSLETREAAVMYARQQDALIQQAVAEGVRAQLAPYAEVVAPSLFHRDIAGVNGPRT